MTEIKDEGGFTVMGVDAWQERWKKRSIGFHNTDVHPMLKKHADAMINNRKNIRIFFPMCGKSVDMKWLGDQRHTIIGVECAEMALQEFFEENGLEYTTEPVEEINGKVLKSQDGRYILYCCDIYMFTKELEGQFSGIWDRGAFVAINRHDRSKYSTMMKTLMAPDCHYLLDTLDYNEKLYAGPPHYVPVEQIYSLFGDICNIEEVDIMDALEQKHKDWGLDYFNDRIHLLTLKNS